MTLAERIARLEERERRLLFVLGAVFGVIVVIFVPVGLAALVHTKSSDNEALRAAANDIQDSRDVLERAKAQRQAILERYSRPAPPLAAFLAGLAQQAGVEIPESQDRQAVPHGKRYTERMTKVAVRKVGMLKLVRFMEKIEQSGHPVSISQLNIRKRGTEQDSYDVEMIVSAFDRKESKEDKPATGAAKADETQPKVEQ
jgi:general secretion pathway protein M